MSSPRFHRYTTGDIPPGVALVPEEFPERLVALKELVGLPWEGMSSVLGVDPRQLWRWRNGGEPNGGAVLALVRLALHVPGGLAALLGEDVVVIRGLDGNRHEFCPPADTSRENVHEGNGG